MNNKKKVSDKPCDCGCNSGPGYRVGIHVGTETHYYNACNECYQKIQKLQSETDEQRAKEVTKEFNQEWLATFQGEV